MPMMATAFTKAAVSEVQRLPDPAVRLRALVRVAASASGANRRVALDYAVLDPEHIVAGSKLGRAEIAHRDLRTALHDRGRLRVAKTRGDALTIHVVSDLYAAGELADLYLHRLKQRVHVEFFDRLTFPRSQVVLSNGAARRHSQSDGEASDCEELHVLPFDLSGRAGPARAVLTCHLRATQAHKTKFFCGKLANPSTRE